MKREYDLKHFGGNGNKALERDGYACVKCQMTNDQHKRTFGCFLSVDHIDGKGRYSEIQNNSMDNLQTLCLVCHGKKDAVKKRVLRITDAHVEQIKQDRKNGLSYSAIAKKFKISDVYALYIAKDMRRDVKRRKYLQ